MTLATRLMGTLGLVLGLILMQPSGAAAEGYGQQKVVYHINYSGGDAGKAYKGAMNNIQNHINAVGAENMDIKVVLHGDGLGLLANARDDQSMQAVISNLKTQNVVFNVCNNTLSGRKISYSDDLFDVWESDIVPSGVAELSKLQIDGYTYIKP